MQTAGQGQVSWNDAMAANEKLRWLSKTVGA
jgi:hypothetical protein